MNTSKDLERLSFLFRGNSKQRSETIKEKILHQAIEAIDCETTGLDTYSPTVQVTHASYWTSKDKGGAFEVKNHDEVTRLRKVAADKLTTKLMFNAKFDLRMLSKIGIECRGWVIDVMLLAQLLLPEEKQKNLKHLVRKFLKDPYLEEIKLKQWLRQNHTKIYGHAPAHIIQPYALADARRTIELFYFLSGGIDKHNLWPVVAREMMLMRQVVMPMEEYGVMIDLDEVARLKISVAKELRNIKSQLVEITKNPKFNPNSGKQVLEVLTAEGIFKPTRFSRKTAKPKVDIIALLQYPSKLGSLVVQYRKISKAASTYLKNFDKPILRVNFNQGGTRTGRFSSSGPNLQNIPRPKEDSLLGSMRRCFIARPGDRLLFVDYDQIELRLAAHFSQEEHMVNAIRDKHDLHAVTCKITFDKKEADSDWDLFRYLAKTLNFSTLYGTGANKYCEIVLKQTDGRIRLSLTQASTQLNAWKEKHPRIMRLFDSVAIEVAKTGGVTNHYGRYMPVDASKSYVGVNYKIQGTAADFMKLKMLRVAAILKGKRSRLIMTVHDELVFNIVREEAYLMKILVEAMQDLTTFSVPLTCSASYGKNWQDKKKLIFT